MQGLLLVAVTPSWSKPRLCSCAVCWNAPTAVSLDMVASAAYALTSNFDRFSGDNRLTTLPADIFHGLTSLTLV